MRIGRSWFDKLTTNGETSQRLLLKGMTPSVRPELASPAASKDERPFDKLRANGLVGS